MKLFTKQGVIQQDKERLGDEDENIHKRTICDQANARSGALQQGAAGKDQGNRKKTGDFRKISGADRGDAQ